MLEQQKEKIKLLFDSDVSFAKIAKEVGSKEYIVLRFCRAQGWRRERLHGPKPTITQICKGCGSKFKKCGYYYCSPECGLAHREKKKAEKIKPWLDGEDPGPVGKFFLKPRYIRPYLMKESGEKCVKCGWGEKNPSTGNSPLEVNHIDGNCLNNAKTNLELLCPNCHSLTPNYRALNKVSSRPYKLVQAER